MNCLARNVDSVFIGVSWGPDEAGYYSRAQALMLVPVYQATMAIGSVLIPALSSLKDDFERLAKAFRSSIEISACVCFPVVAGIAATAAEAVRLLYGPDWLPIVPMLCWLSLSCVVQTLNDAQQWLLIASGRPRTLFLLTLVSAVVSVCAYSVAVQWGAIGVSAARGLVGSLLLAPLLLVVVHRAVHLRLGLTLRAVLPVIFCSGLMGAIVWSAGVALYQIGLGWREILLLKIAIGILTYALLMMLFARGTVLRVLRHMGVMTPDASVVPRSEGAGTASRPS
jgi:PST family polysaccharide transporter